MRLHVVHLVGVVAALALLTSPGWGQGTGDEGVRDLVRIQKTRLTLEAARLEYEIAGKSAEAGLISTLELERKRSAYQMAQLDHLEAMVAGAGSLWDVRVRSARKARDGNGRIHVKVTLGFSGVSPQATLSEVAQDAASAQLLRTVSRLMVSLRSDGMIVSDPYQIALSPRRDGETEELDFCLLKDVDAVEVAVTTGGRERATRVQLQHDSTGREVALLASAIAQEADLGSAASFDLTVERFSRESSLFRLDVESIPADVAYEFVDSETSARITQVTFPEGATAKKVRLTIRLPTRPSDKVVIDRPLSFRVWCLDSKRGALDRSPAGTDATRRAGAFIPLEVIPRGIGKIDLEVVNLYREIAVGNQLAVSGRVVNKGTRRVDNVRLSVQAPLDWRVSVSPSGIASLEETAEAAVTVTLVGPGDAAGVGDFDARLRLEGTSSGRKIEGEERVLRIHVVPRTRFLGIFITALAILGVVVGMVVVGIRLTRV